MTIWIVEQECDDSYYGYNLLRVFKTKELAEEYLNLYESYEQQRMEISELTVDEIVDKK